MTLNEVAPPGWGHTKAEKEKTKPNKPKSKIGGTAAAFKRALDDGRFKGLPGSTTKKEKTADMFKLMYSMKKKGAKPHYKPGTDKKYKKYQEEQSNPRIPRKKGQPANSKKHSDLYTDENPKGTIHGLGFKDVATAKASVSKIRNSSRSHAHKIQAAVAMEQRAREMGKTSEAAVYRKFINTMKKKTKQMNESVQNNKVDLVLKTDVNNVLKQDNKDYDRGLLAKVNKDGSYDVAYWYDKYKAYPVEVEIDGKSVKKDAKIIHIKYHPELKKKNKEDAKAAMKEQTSMQDNNLYGDAYASLKKKVGSKKKHDKPAVEEGIMQMVKRATKKKEERKPEKAMDAGARARRKVARRVHAKYVSGSTENVPDDIREGSLRKWFKGSKSKDGKGGWVNVVTGGTCASDEPGEGTPKCVSSAKRASMTKAERLSAARRKKAADPGQQSKSGAAKPTYVRTDAKKKMKEEKELKVIAKELHKASKLHKGQSKALAKASKMHKGQANKLEKMTTEGHMELETKKNCGCGQDPCITFGKKKLTQAQRVDEKCWDGYTQKGLKKKGNRMVPNCVPISKEEYYERYKDMLDEACWKGYEKKGMKTMFGKRYPNCVKKKATRKEEVQVEAKVDQGRSDYGKASIRNYRRSGPGHGEPAMFDPENKRGKLIDKRREEHKARRGVKGAKVPAYKTEEAQLTETDKKGKGSGTKDACYHKVKSRYSVWPSAYASGALVKCRKVGAANWGNSSKKEEFEGWTSDPILEKVAAWQRKEGKNPEGGLNQKGVDSYRKANPGSKLKTAVTTKPSKLKKGSKAASRRKSFCARMGGMKKRLTSAKTANDPDSRINKALRKWNC
tara:strand:+ start:991 stop:3519 length:2529 start_codon:yes stop_codon:yes gene_type:complete